MDFIKRQEQKKQSRIRNNKTTIQLSRALKDRLGKIKDTKGFDSLEEALDEVISEYENYDRGENE